MENKIIQTKSLDPMFFYREYKHTLVVFSHAKQMETFSFSDTLRSETFHLRAPAIEGKKMLIVQTIS